MEAKGRGQAKPESGRVARPGRRAARRENADGNMGALRRGKFFIRVIEIPARLPIVRRWKTTR
jgi:hypothetical protein